MITKRGIVLSPADLDWEGWIEGMQQAGLNYLGLCSSFGDLLGFAVSPRGQAVLAAAVDAGIEVNFEMHVLSSLLPRHLFERSPELFRMDEAGNRTADANFCVSNETARAIVGENAREFSARLRKLGDFGRHYFWPDDYQPWCHCPDCRELTYSDQALTYANLVCEALRKVRPSACVAHLAYGTALEPPTRVRPAEGVFLQFAPIRRRYDAAFDAPDCDENRRHADVLAALLGVFDARQAEALEYWLDVSMFSRWQKPAVRLPFSEEFLQADVAFYRRQGIRRISTFGVYIDAEYVERFGYPPLQEYGAALEALPD